MSESVKTHGPDRCAGRPCCVHNPSDHGMRDFPLYFRMDRGGFAERVCPHGVGHPDPDSLDYFAQQSSLDVGTFREERAWLGVHGCCGFRCCKGADNGS